MSDWDDWAEVVRVYPLPLALSVLAALLCLPSWGYIIVLLWKNRRP